MGATRYLLAPWWLAQLATGAKSFRDNPLIGSPALNARGLHSGRVRAAHAMAWHRRRRLGRLLGPADRAAFDRDGFVQKRDFLPAEAFARLRDAALAYRGPAREMVQGDTITRRIALDPEALETIPEARALLADPRWRGLTRYAASFDSEPIVYIQTILAGRHEGPPDPQTNFHSDTFHPSMKAWLFLTDVEERDGPFAYVPGSHRATPERLAWERKMSLTAASSADRMSSRGSLRIAASELSSLGLPPPRSFPVPANTLVVADTYGFHARMPASHPSTRIELWAYGRRSPFLPWTGMDLLSLPGLAERRVPSLWRWRDRLSGWIGQPWADVGRKRPGDE
jgi:hypothetical protein